MTHLESFKNGLWIHSPAILSVPADVCFYRSAPGRYAFGDSTSPATYVAVNRGLEIAVGVALPDFAAVAGALTVNMRTQSAGGVGPSNGGDLILLTGNPTGAGRRGYFNVTGAGAGAQTTMIGATAGGLSTGADCTFLGFAAGRDMVAAINGTFIGSQAGLAATGANNTAVGAAAGIEIARANNVVIGSNASAAAGDGNVVIGGFADLDAAAGVLIGSTGILSANQSVAIGSSINVTAAFSVTLGDSAFNPMASSIVMGHAATTSTANTAVLGSATDPINILYGGKGEKAAAPTAWMVSGTAPRDGTDVDTAGAALQLAGGRGTGNGLRGNVELSFSRVVGAGSGAQTNEVCLAFRGLTTPGVFTPAVNTNSGATVYTRTQQGGAVGNTNGGDWIVQLGEKGAAAGAAFRRGYFNVTGAGAAARTTFIGENAGTLCTSGDCVCVGPSAGSNLINALNNTAVGSSALAANDYGTGNTAVGYCAGQWTTASSCTFVGAAAGAGCTAGINTIIGASAGATLTTGGANTIVGRNANVAATTTADVAVLGAAASATTQSVAIGSAAVSATGNLNVVIGYNSTATGASNVLIGPNALVTGSGTVAIGASVNVTASNATAVGVSTSALAGGLALGYGASASANVAVMGSNGVPINILYGGLGETNAATLAWAVSGTGGATVPGNSAGSDLELRGGPGTGTGVGGHVLIRNAPYGAAGGTVNPPATHLDVNQYGLTAHTPSAALTLVGDVVPAAVPPEWTLTAAAHGAAPGCGILAATERMDVYYNLTRTVRWASGNIALQRAFRITAPTYSIIAGVSQTIATAATFYVDDAPQAAGGGTAITQSYGIYQAAGNSYFGGALNLNTAPGAAVSPAGEGRIRYNNGTSAFEVSINNNPYVALVTGVMVGPGGADSEIQYNNGGAFGGSPALTYDDTGGNLWLTFNAGLRTKASADPGAWTAAANTSGTTVYARTQSGGVDAGANPTGANLVLITGAKGAGGTGRAGYFNVTNSAAGVRTTYIGEDAGNLATVADNACFGYRAGYAMTTGTCNVFVGSGAGGACTTANYNVAVGKGALAAMTTSGVNTAVGDSALAACTGNNNTAVGGGAGKSVTSGGVVAVGQNCLQNVTTGSGNIGIGNGVGGSMSTHSRNVLIGNDISSAGGVQGDDNTCVGHWIGRYFGSNAGSAVGNVVIGSYAMNNGSAAGIAGSPQYNVVIGFNAALLATRPTDSVVIGNEAGRSTNAVDVTFDKCVAVGKQAGYSLTTSGSSVLIGYRAGYAATTASGATCVGASAGAAVTGSAQFTAVGCLAGTVATGNNGTFVGYEAGLVASSGNNSTFVGSQAGYSTTTPSHNTFIGNQAGKLNVTGAENTYVGQGAGYANLGSYTVCIGRNCMDGGITPVATSNDGVHIGYQAARYCTSDRNVNVGREAGCSGTFGGFSLGAYADCVNVGYRAGYVTETASANVFVGSGAGVACTTASYNVAVGKDTLAAMTVNGAHVAVGDSAGKAYTGGPNLTAVGAGALKSATSGGSTAVGGNALGNCSTGTSNTAVGDVSLRNITTETNNVAMGVEAGYECRASGNTYIGAAAGRGMTGHTLTGANNVGVGYLAMNSAGAVGAKAFTQCVAVGASAGLLLTSATGCVLIGYQAGDAITSGGDNVGIGSNALGVHQTGANNVAIGSGALGSSITGTQNVAVGMSAGMAATGNAGVFVGYAAGLSTTGASNTIVGSFAAAFLTTGTHNVLIGGSADVPAAGTAVGGVAIGHSAVNSSSSVAIGYAATTSAAIDSIALGRSAATLTANTMVCGSSSYPINVVYASKGETHASPTYWAIAGTGGSGSDIAGGNLEIRGGRGTGTGAGGCVQIRTAPMGATGAGLNTLGTRLEWCQYGLVAHTPAAALTLAGSVSGAVAPEWTLTAAAHGASPGPGILASTERFDVYYNLNRTVTWATGGITTQRAFVIQAPTYAFVGASAVDFTATLYISGAPIVGANATLSNAYGLWVDSGKVRFDGGLLHPYDVRPYTEASSPVSVTDYYSNTVFTNEGAGAQVIFNLPAAVAGLTYTYIVQAAQNLRVVASGGDTIRLAATVSAAAGYCEAATVGNAVRLVAINTTEWIAVSLMGSWTVV